MTMKRIVVVMAVVVSVLAISLTSAFAQQYRFMTDPNWLKDVSVENDGKKISDLWYHNDVIYKAKDGSVTISIKLLYTDWGKKSTPRFPQDASYVAMILEVTPDFRMYRTWSITYFKTDDEVVTFHHNSSKNIRWVVPKENTMAKRWVELAKFISQTH